MQHIVFIKVAELLYICDEKQRGIVHKNKVLKTLEERSLVNLLKH